jgi:hypothetical protein
MGPDGGEFSPAGPSFGIFKIQSGTTGPTEAAEMSFRMGDRIFYVAITSKIKPLSAEVTPSCLQIDPKGIKLIENKWKMVNGQWKIVYCPPTCRELTKMI